jgi:hypothetical protein
MSAAGPGLRHRQTQRAEWGLPPDGQQRPPPVVTSVVAPRATAEVVGELLHHLRGLRNEAALLTYLSAMKAGFALLLPLDVHTAHRLHAALYPLTAPGGPLYPTRAVRHAATDTLDALFPSGRAARRLVALCFRMMHPLQWPASFVHWVAARLPPQGVISAARSGLGRCIAHARGRVCAGYSRLPRASADGGRSESAGTASATRRAAEASGWLTAPVWWLLHWLPAWARASGTDARPSREE